MLPSGIPGDQLIVSHDGTPVPRCPGGPAGPDPCVADVSLQGHVYAVQVRGTDLAGKWNLATDYSPPDFVTRNGTALMLGGEAFRPIGLNIYNANSNGFCASAMDGTLLSQSLMAIGPGKNVIRSWFFQQLATTDGQRDWTAFDRTLATARSRGYKVVATLIDQWGNCGAANGQGYGYKDAVVVPVRLHPAGSVGDRVLPGLGGRGRRALQVRLDDHGVAARQRAGGRELRARSRNPRRRRCCATSWQTSPVSSARSTRCT